MASADRPPLDDRTWLRGAPDHAPFPDPVTAGPGDDHAMVAPPGADGLGKALRSWVDAFDGHAGQDAASSSTQEPASNM
jgi:hypothetical protein